MIYVVYLNEESISIKCTCLETLDNADNSLE